MSVDIDNLPYRERKRLYGCIYAVEQRCQEIVEELSVRWHQQALKKYLLDNDCEDIRRQTRICIMCGNVFTLEKNEVESYLTKNLHLPKRCPTCIRKNEVLNASPNAHTLENPFYYESQVYYSKLIGTDDKFWRSDNFKPRECYIDADKNNQPLQSWLKAIMKARLEYCKQQLQIDGISKRWFYFDLSVCYSFFKDEDKKNYYAKKHLDAFDE